MRIAVLSRSFKRSGGGAESYSVAIAQELAKWHEVHVFAQEFGAIPVRTEPVEGRGLYTHRVLCVSRKPRWLNQLVFATATWWHTRRGFDVVHSHENTWHGQIQTIHVRPLLHNLLWNRHGLARALRWVKVALSPRLITYVALEGARFKPQPGRCVVATSEHLRLECEQAYPRATRPMEVITPGTQLPDELPTREAARQALGLPLEPRVILFVANDYARKGLDTLLPAFAKLKGNVLLALVGNKNTAPKYEALAKQLGVAERVKFLGPREDMHNAYCAADCLAHPTLEDSFAMVVLEAMAHGLPVVVSAAPYCGVSAQLQNGMQAVLLNDPKDVEVLRRELMRVLAEPEWAQHLREQAGACAQRHSWNTAAVKYEKLCIEARAHSL